MSYKRQVSRALGWSAGAKVVSQFFSFAIGIFLARLLTPDDFGLVAMIVVFTGFAALLGDVGLGSALVQKADAEERHYSTVFWTNLGLGILLAVAVYCLSKLIAQFYGREELIDASRLLALSFVVSALAMVQRQRLVKALNFKLLAIADFIGMIVGGGLGVWLAWQGFGYWALIAQGLTQQLVATVLVWLHGRWFPRLIFDYEALRELFGFSFYVFLTGCLLHLTRHIDKLLVGRFMGGTSVGLLDKAQSMMLFPLQNISHVVGSVMFPALSMIQNDKEKVKAVYLKSVQMIALLAFPMVAGIYAVADNFVLGVLGEQWSEIIPVLRVLCVAGFASSIATITGSLYLSQGAARLQFHVNLVTRPLAIVAVFVGMNWGVIGVSVGLATATWVNTLITLRSAGRLIDLGLLELLGSIFKVAICAMAMGAVVLGVPVMFEKSAHVLVLFAQVFTGLLFYILLVLLVGVPQAKEVVVHLRKRFAA